MTMRRLKIRDFMTKDVATVPLDAPFASIARLLVERRINSAPVVDRIGHVCGMVSMSDLLHKEGNRDDPENTFAFAHSTRVSHAKGAATTAAKLMTAPAIEVGPDVSVVSAAKLMARKRVKQLPVVEGGTLVGIVTRSDLVRAFLRPDDDIRDDVEAEFIAHRSVWSRLDGITVEVDNGVVMLTGDVERRSELVTAVKLASRIEGVVDVRPDLTYSFDDTVPVYPGF
ncbi:MAG: CBS domain-containing protein [Streptosporangiales bacterium]|nr:CBS domain-containing protein [Streptosporangiales bacterium]